MYIHVWLDLGTFCIFHQNWDFAVFSIYNVWITSLLSMNIYNSTIGELQHFVMQLLILPVLRVVNLHVLILKIEHYSKCWIFADLVTIIIRRCKKGLTVQCHLFTLHTQCTYYIHWMCIEPKQIQFQSTSRGVWTFKNPLLPPKYIYIHTCIHMYIHTLHVYNYVKTYLSMRV